jgi:hypothetical protein
MALSDACRAAVGEILKIRLIRAKDAAPVDSVLYESGGTMPRTGNRLSCCADHVAICMPCCMA